MPRAQETEGELARIALLDPKERMKQAAAEYNRCRLTGGSSVHGCGLRPIAAAYGVNYGTLRLRVHGTVNIAAFNAETKGKMTAAEEEVLLELALISADRGFGFDREGLHGMATSLVHARTPEVDLGKNWVDRFIKRHPELKMHWSHSLSKAVTPAVNTAEYV